MTLLPDVKKQSSKHDFVTADQWFEGGRRVYYDVATKEISDTEVSSSVAVFERVRLPMYSTSLPHRNTRWLTFLPGFPVGSYSYAKVDVLLEKQNNIKTPRLYVDYVGQGDSDKPPSKTYSYNTMERADLVEAQWRNHGVRKSVVVALDYSATVLMELLRRQQEKPSSFTKIEHVLFLNGGLFADCHPETPWGDTPLLRMPFGRSMGSAMAQRSNLVCEGILRSLYSKSEDTHRRKLLKRELREVIRAVRRRQGAFFLLDATRFAEEHEQYASRWNLRDICTDSAFSDVSFRVVMTEGASLEGKRVCDRLKVRAPRVKAECISGGYMMTSEKATRVAAMVETLTFAPET